MIVREHDRCRIEGAVTVDTVGGLLRELHAHAGQGVVRLDFSTVERIDSAVLALIFSAQRACGGKLLLSGLPTGFHALAELYGVTELLPA